MTTGDATVNHMQHKVVLSCIVVQSFYIDCILVKRCPDDGHRGYRNMLVRNNYMWLNMLMNTYLLVYHVSIKRSVQHGHQTHKVHFRIIMHFL